MLRIPRKTLSHWRQSGIKAKSSVTLLSVNIKSQSLAPKLFDSVPLEVTPCFADHQTGSFDAIIVINMSLFCPPAIENSRCPAHVSINMTAPGLGVGVSGYGLRGNKVLHHEYCLTDIRSILFGTLES